MSIEVTDEMIEAFHLAGVDGPDVHAGLKAVLAIVERDREISPKLCGNLQWPGEEDASYRKCELLSGHAEKRHGRWVENDGWESWK